MEQMLKFYSTSVDTASVPTTNVDYNEFYVRNGFTDALISKIIEPCFAAGKIPMFVFNDAVNKCGIAVERMHKKQILEFGIPANEVYNANKDSAVINLLQYNGWFAQDKTLMQEIAEVQWVKNGFKGAYQSTAKKDKMLFTDYLLSNAICYVEIFNANTVDKFLATRNIGLLMQLSTMYKDDKEKVPYLRLNKDLGTSAVRAGYTSYLALTTNGVNKAMLPYVKLTGPTKKLLSYSLVMPRGTNATLNGDMQYRITPAFMLIRQNKFLYKLLMNNVVTLEYLKDNLQIREITTTGNPTFLSKAMDGDTERVAMCTKAFNGIGGLVGSYKLPDLDLVKSDSFLRAVNLRICKIKVNGVNAQGVYNVACDLMQVPDIFKQYLRANSTNHAYLQYISYLLNSLAYRQRITQMKDELQHYMIMSQQSKYAVAHQRMVQYITAEINNQLTATQKTVEYNTNQKTAEQLYVELLAIITDNVKQRTTAYCKQLYTLMLENQNMFPECNRYFTVNTAVAV